MTRLGGLEPAQDRVAEERQVADRVEDLVAHELVLEAQLVVEDAGLADHDRVLEAAAERQAALAQELHLAQEAEGARRCDLLGEAARRHPQRERLVPQQRVVEADRVADLEVLARDEPRALGAVNHLDGLLDPQQLARHRERPQPRLVQQDHEGRRAAVEHRDFRAVHLDAHVVDAEARERRQQVLDRADRDAVPAAASWRGPGSRCGRASRGISTPTSVRTKRMPCSAGAGTSRRRTGRPQWSPIPVHATSRLSVRR